MPAYCHIANSTPVAIRNQNTTSSMRGGIRINPPASSDRDQAGGWLHWEKPDARWLRSTCSGPCHHVSTLRDGLFRLGLIHVRIERHAATTEDHPRGYAVVRRSYPARRLLRRLSLRSLCRREYWGDDVRLSDLRPSSPVGLCGHRGAGFRPLFEPARMGTG